MNKILLLLFLYPVSSMASSYGIAAKSTFTTDYSACTMAESLNVFYEKEQSGSITEEEKETYSILKELLEGESLNEELARVAEEIAISVDLPASLVLNKSNFFISGFDGKQVGTFASDILFEMDEHGVVELPGSGKTSFKVKLKVAAFCPYLTDENENPSVETILSDLIK